MARVLISMPEKFLDEIDSVANYENRTRSELIREALRTYMYRNQVRNSKKATTNAPNELNTKDCDESVLPKAAPSVWYFSSSPQ